MRTIGITTTFVLLEHERGSRRTQTTILRFPLSVPGLFLMTKCQDVHGIVRRH